MPQILHLARAHMLFPFSLHCPISCNCPAAAALFHLANQPPLTRQHFASLGSRSVALTLNAKPREASHLYGWQPGTSGSVSLQLGSNLQHCSAEGGEKLLLLLSGKDPAGQAWGSSAAVVGSVSAHVLRRQHLRAQRHGSSKRSTYEGVLVW